jgi:ubiquinone/menaquinone biosynthesis C-methylase UbiE
MVRIVDPEEAHLTALRDATDFRGRRVLEIGCGEGRLTWGIAADADYVLATDPDEERVATARATRPEQLREKVRFDVADAASIDVPRSSFDIVLFSWSL